MYRRFASSLLQSFARAEQTAVLSRALSVVAARQFVSKPSCSPICWEQTRSYSLVRRMGQPKVPQELTKKEVEEKVLHAVKSWDRFPSDRLDKLNLEARFMEDLGFDSLDHVEIIMSVEEEFGHEIPDDKAEKLKTPKDVVAYICEEEDILE